MKLGMVWSKEIIDSELLPKVPVELLPWLIKDRREAVEGSYVKDSNGNKMHDGQGLDKAKQSLRTAKEKLKEEITDGKIRDFLNFQEAAAQSKVDFYDGKIYLLDKIIEQTKTLK